MPNLPRPKVPIRENASTMIGKPTLYATTYNQWDLEKLPTVDEVQVERVKYEAERQYDTKPIHEGYVPPYQDVAVSQHTSTSPGASLSDFRYEYTSDQNDLPPLPLFADQLKAPLFRSAPTRNTQNLKLPPTPVPVKAPRAPWLGASGVSAQMTPIEDIPQIMTTGPSLNDVAASNTMPTGYFPHHGGPPLLVGNHESHPAPQLKPLTYATPAAPQYYEAAWAYPTPEDSSQAHRQADITTKAAHHPKGPSGGTDTKDYAYNRQAPITWAPPELSNSPPMTPEYYLTPEEDLTPPEITSPTPLQKRRDPWSRSQARRTRGQSTQPPGSLEPTVSNPGSDGTGAWSHCTPPQSDEVQSDSVQHSRFSAVVASRKWPEITSACPPQTSTWTQNTTCPITPPWPAYLYHTGGSDFGSGNDSIATRAINAAVDVMIQLPNEVQAGTMVTRLQHSPMPITSHPSSSSWATASSSAFSMDSPAKTASESTSNIWSQNNTTPIKRKPLPASPPGNTASNTQSQPNEPTPRFKLTNRTTYDTPASARDVFGQLSPLEELPDFLAHQVVAGGVAAAPVIVKLPPRVDDGATWKSKKSVNAGVTGSTVEARVPLSIIPANEVPRAIALNAAAAAVASSLLNTAAVDGSTGAQSADCSATAYIPKSPKTPTRKPVPTTRQPPASITTYTPVPVQVATPLQAVHRTSHPTATIFPSNPPPTSTPRGHNRSTSQPTASSTSPFNQPSPHSTGYRQPTTSYEQPITGYRRPTTYTTHTSPQRTASGSSILNRPRPISRRGAESAFPVRTGVDKPLPRLPNEGIAEQRRHTGGFEGTPTSAAWSGSGGVGAGESERGRGSEALAALEQHRYALEARICELKAQLVLLPAYSLAPTTGATTTTPTPISPSSSWSTASSASTTIPTSPNTSPPPWSYRSATSWAQSSKHSTGRLLKAEISVLEEAVEECRLREHDEGIRVWRRWRAEDGGAEGAMWVRRAA